MAIIASTAYTRCSPSLIVHMRSNTLLVYSTKLAAEALSKGAHQHGMSAFHTSQSLLPDGCSQCNSRMKFLFAWTRRAR